MDEYTRGMIAREEMNRTQGTALWPTLDHLAETNPIIRAWVMGFRRAGACGFPVSQDTMLAEMIAMLDKHIATLEAMSLKFLNTEMPTHFLLSTIKAETAGKTGVLGDENGK